MMLLWGSQQISASPPFSPVSLFANGEQGWFIDPQDLTSLFQNSNGTGAVAVGDPVGYATDKSGRGHHLIQATGSRRPLLQQNGGGFKYLVNDALDDYIRSASTYLMGNNHFIGAAIDRTSEVATTKFLGALQSTTNGHYFQSAASGSRLGATLRTAGGSFALSGQALGTIAPHVFTSQFTGGVGGTMDERVDGALPTVSTIIVTAYTAPTVTPIIFSTAEAGSAVAAEFKIYRAIAINRLLTAGERANVRTWLAAGYGSTQ